MKILSRKGSIVLLIIVATFTLMQVYGRFMVVRSDPYLFSIQFLMNNRNVTDRIGKPQKIALAIFDSYDVHNNPVTEGTAKFTFVVHGLNGDGKALLELSRKKKDWQMNKADLLLKNGQQVDLLSGTADLSRQKAL